MSNLYLPQLAAPPTVPGQSAPPVDPYRTCVASKLFVLIRDHPAQQRSGMVWDSVLAAAALHKCERQAKEGWDDHIDPQGLGPHDLVRAHGYRLASVYPNGAANYIESLCHDGDGTAQSALTAWLSSPGHKAHVLGEIGFYAAQVYIGIAYLFAPGSAKRHYYAFISCPAEGD